MPVNEGCDKIKLLGQSVDCLFFRTDEPGAAARSHQKEKCWMELRIQIDDLDYGELAAQLLPLLPEGIDGLGSGLLSGAKKNPALVKGLVNAMPQKKKEELVISLINRHSERIMKGLTKAAASRGVAVKVSNLRAGIPVKRAGSTAKTATDPVKSAYPEKNNR